LSATVAYFDIIKTNVATADPFHPGFTVTTGAVQNRGLEFDIQGQLFPEVKLISSFAYINSKIIADNSGNVGHRFNGVPALGGSLWAVCEPQAEWVRGLALGGGLVARSDVEFDDANTFALPGYTIVNLMARYKFSVANTRLSFQVNANNVLDKVYYVTAGGGIRGSFPGTPRTALGSLTMEF